MTQNKIPPGASEYCCRTCQNQPCPLGPLMSFERELVTAKTGCFLHSGIAARDAVIRNAAFIEARNIVSNRVVYGMCAFDGDCSQCFLCDNAGGCIVHTDEEIRKMTHSTGSNKNTDNNGG